MSDCYFNDDIILCVVYRTDGSYIVKVADFGMSRDIYEKDYYVTDNMNKPLPIKWMSVESLREGRYTSKSDVVRISLLLVCAPNPSCKNYGNSNIIGVSQIAEFIDLHGNKDMLKIQWYWSVSWSQNEVYVLVQECQQPGGPVVACGTRPYFMWPSFT